jgi:sugar phosphate isomerase/epimerase
MFSWFSYPMPIEERLRKIKHAGFNATSLWWGDEDGRDLQPDIARNFGLFVDNIHAPFDNPNSLWLDSRAGEQYLETLIACVDECKLHSIPVAVIHLTGFNEVAPITELGLDRIKRLVDHAQTQEVNLAFENLSSLDHLEYVFNNVSSSRVGFCFDSGHENCNHPNADCLSKYSHRLFAVHLADNYGDSDTHLLPYDGTVDWKALKKKLDNCQSLDCFTLEADFNPKHVRSAIYRDLSADEFLALAYERAVKFLAEE